MPRDLVAEATLFLERLWGEICELAGQGEFRSWIEDPALMESIRSAINSSTRSYHYVLPTQIAAKLADSTLDSRCLQVARGGEGAFDARTIAHQVIVPFDQAHENVLGGSPEPYVNNPLRVPEISDRHRNAQRNRRDWDHLCAVLAAVEEKQNPSFTESVFRQVLTEIYRRLSEVQVLYPTPRRISLRKSTELVESFLSTHSGGDRLLALASGLFVVIGRSFRLYSDVRRASITASDTATGMMADLECMSARGEVVLAVEVKDRELTISQMRGKIPTIREKQVSEIFFIAERGVAPADDAHIKGLIDREFASGHNIYVTDLTELCRVVLALLGEKGRRRFLKEIGHQLDEYRSDVAHRRAWARLLAEL